MKKILIGFIVFLMLFAMIGLTLKAQAEETVSKSDISKKLDEILKNQKDILDQIAVLKEEMRIIKVRVTQNQ